MNNNKQKDIFDFYIKDNVYILKLFNLSYAFKQAEIIQTLGNISSKIQKTKGVNPNIKFKDVQKDDGRHGLVSCFEDYANEVSESFCTSIINKKNIDLVNDYHFDNMVNLVTFKRGPYGISGQSSFFKKYLTNGIFLTPNYMLEIEEIVSNANHYNRLKFGQEEPCIFYEDSKDGISIKCPMEKLDEALVCLEIALDERASDTFHKTLEEMSEKQMKQEKKNEDECIFIFNEILYIILINALKRILETDMQLTISEYNLLLNLIKSKYLKSAYKDELTQILRKIKKNNKIKKNHIKNDELTQ